MKNSRNLFNFLLISFLEFYLMTGFFLIDYLMLVFILKYTGLKVAFVDQGHVRVIFIFHLTRHFPKCKGVVFHVASSFEARKTEMGSRTLVAVDNCIIW